ncbi:hypothetical protein N7499_003366 [Penicillium canescens]|uniref:Major facilitator superfamily (MFS) profile domain-containing protein n=1 Tax=Penicillium canescens TaxID=5083 RepID=A0AAD6N783_PENCN|nr:hypothetical protein N7522_000151 [Penicillium canescens]KAJ6038014.1 hypothetical protein N7460_007785 [Penicillium canescens]KAJ6061116.1 hypothetical protein N7444_001812 [Penicillium canescens]KAJ6090652.1 hypothetical protein N7499_003366 [Penicillium canescens]KAJ6174836.1 hypothetical protein N7485_004641 [Penicillium canescens]
MASILQFWHIARLGTDGVILDAELQTLGEGSGDDILLVDAKPTEPSLNPRLWPLYKRVLCTVLATSVGFIVSWAGSITSAAAENASVEFGVSETVESLATGLYFIGFGLGSLLAGPISETLGRNAIYIVAMTLFMVFIAASGAAPNIEAQLIFRFLAGFFGNTPLTCAGGSLADLWSPEERVIVVPIYSVGIFDGSALGPVVGGWVAQGASSGALSWRWVEWITLCISAVILLLIVLFLPETYAPVLLQWKAHSIRTKTKDSRYRAPIEVTREPLMKRLGRAMQRPFAFLLREPIIIAIALYLVLLYVVFFTFLNGFPFIFGNTYHWGSGITGTAFMAIFIGQHIPLTLMPITRKWAALYKARREADGAQEIDPPENRLWIAMVGAVALPISLFWLGWTAYPDISPWSGLAAGVLFGFACVAIYIGFYMYVIDTYAMYAASGLASTTVLRYVVAGAMIAPSIPMYARLGSQWTLTLFGVLSVIMGTVPFVFFRYGFFLRSKSFFVQQLR